jgi:hypothetical protein
MRLLTENRDNLIGYRANLAAAALVHELIAACANSDALDCAMSDFAKLIRREMKGLVEDVLAEELERGKRHVLA